MQVLDFMDRIRGGDIPPGQDMECRQDSVQYLAHYAAAPTSKFPTNCMHVFIFMSFQACIRRLWSRLERVRQGAIFSMYRTAKSSLVLYSALCKFHY